MLHQQPFDAIPPEPPTRPAHQGEHRRSDVGQARRGCIDGSVRPPPPSRFLLQAPAASRVAPPNLRHAFYANGATIASEPSNAVRSAVDAEVFKEYQSAVAFARRHESQFWAHASVLRGLVFAQGAQRRCWWRRARQSRRPGRPRSRARRGKARSWVRHH